MLRGKHAEGRREESEELARCRLAELQTIYASVPVGLAFVDKNLRFVSINETLAEFNGLPVDEHVGRTLGEVLPAELAEQIEPIYRRVIEMGEPAHPIADGEGQLGGAIAALKCDGCGLCIQERHVKP